MTFIKTEYPIATFSRSGVLSVATGQHFAVIRGAWTITYVVGRVGTASAGASILIDVNRNGTTIFTTQTNRITIAAGALEDDHAAPEVSALAALDRLSVDIDQVGSTTAGSDLTVVIYARPTI